MAGARWSDAKEETFERLPASQHPLPEEASFDAESLEDFLFGPNGGIDVGVEG